jgi:aminoglycoside 3-N-acetyltransferase I
MHTSLVVRKCVRERYDLRAVALPPLRPAAFFCAVVPPCDELLRELDDEPDFFPPRLDEPDEFAILAARCFDMPLSLSASYCFSFLTFELLLGMTNPLSIEIRRLGPGDGDVVTALADYPGLQERIEFLNDDRTFLFAAFEGDAPVGFVLAYELLRRHGDRSMLFVYEVDVVETHRRQGIATALFAALADAAREREIREAFVLTEADNAAANALYASLGGWVEAVNQWELRYTAS